MAIMVLKCAIQGHLLFSLYNLPASSTYYHLHARTSQSSSLDCMLAISIMDPRHLTPTCLKLRFLTLTSSTNTLFFLWPCLCGAVITIWSLVWKIRSLLVDLSPVPTGLCMANQHCKPNGVWEEP